jgi:hypothetical protein
MLLAGIPAESQNSAVPVEAVRLELSKPQQKGALLHWAVTNDLDVAVYAYSFYLWGPAYRVQRSSGHVFIDTTPVAEDPSCPPNRFPPVLLLVIGPHRTIEGDLTDPNVRDINQAGVSMRIAVGFDPYSVVAKAKAFERSNCKHSPYDAIVRWGRIIESKRIDMSTFESPAKPNGAGLVPDVGQ